MGKTIGGSAVDLSTGVQVSVNGDYLICGYSLSNASGEKSENSRGDMDFWILRLHPDGSKIWDKTLGGSAVDVASSLVETDSGEIVVVGGSNSQASADKTQNTVNGANDFDYWVVKLSSQGIKIWDKDFGGADGCNGGGCWNEGAGEVAILNNGILIGGNSQSNSNQFKSANRKGGDDVWLIKLNNDGNMLWDKTIGGDQADYFFSNGNLIVHNSKITLLANSSSGVSGDKSSASIGANDYWLVSLVAEASNQNTCLPFSETQTVVSFNQGKTKGGRAVSPLRSDPNKSIGKSNANDSPKDGIQFVSLGFGGSITLEFEKPLCDKPGNDLRVVETSYGNPSFAVYPEQAEIFVSQDGASWQSLGTTNAKMPAVGCVAKLDTEFDIDGKLPWIKFVQVVDITNPNAHRRRILDCKELPSLAFGNLADGFDLDAVEAIGSLSEKNARAQTIDQLSQPNQLTNNNTTGVIYPNPIETDMVIDLSIEIFDVLAKRLHSFSHHIDNGLSVKFDASSLSSGVYVARVHLGAINVSYKFVKK